MTSRTASPFRAGPSSPGWTRVGAAGDPGATATTRAGGMAQSYGTPDHRPLPAPECSGGTLAKPELATAKRRIVPVDRVLLAQPRGYCAGVEMAIKALAWMVRVFEPPVYCYHEIVHNRLVVERFRNLGVVFVDSLDEVPPGAPLMLSAHGSAPEVVEAARAGGGFVGDAVCPLVAQG